MNGRMRVGRGRREAPRGGKLPWLEEGCTLAKLRSCEQSASERLVDDQRRALCTLQVHIDSWSNLFLRRNFLFVSCLLRPMGTRALIRSKWIQIVSDGFVENRGPVHGIKRLTLRCSYADEGRKKKPVLLLFFFAKFMIIERVYYI